MKFHNLLSVLNGWYPSIANNDISLFDVTRLLCNKFNVDNVCVDAIATLIASYLLNSNKMDCIQKLNDVDIPTTQLQLIGPNTFKVTRTDHYFHYYYTFNPITAQLIIYNEFTNKPWQEIDLQYLIAKHNLTTISCASIKQALRAEQIIELQDELDYLKPETRFKLVLH